MKNIFDISKWRLPTPHEALLELQKIKSRSPKTTNIGRFSKSIAEVDIYSYLRARFGNCNSPAMMFKDPKSSDNLVHWEFFLLHEEYYIRIAGMTGYISIIYTNYETSYEFSPEDWVTLIKSIKKDFESYKHEKSRIQNSFEKWKLTFNPYYRIKIRTCQLQREIEKIKLNIEQTKNLSNVEKDQYFLKNLYSLSDHCYYLNLLLPLRLESFINSIIFMLCKPEVKKDDRHYESVIRANIDIKIKSIHLNCNFFTEKIDINNIRYKHVMDIYSKRNDLIHGNLKPMKHSYSTIYFDGLIPLYKDLDTPMNKLHSHHLQFIKPILVLKQLEKIFLFEEFFLTHIDKKVKESILLILDNSELGWDDKRSRLGVLFPIQRPYFYFETNKEIYDDWENDLNEFFISDAPLIQ